MKKEFTDYVNNIENLLAQLNETAFIPHKDINGLLCYLDEERKIMVETFEKFLFSKKQNGYVGRICKLYFNRLTALSNKAYRKIDVQNPEKINSNNKLIYLNTVICIDDLQKSAMVVARDYLNSRLNASDYTVNSQGKIFMEAYVDIEGLFKQNHVPANLIDIFHDFFQEFSSTYPKAFNYKRIEYAAKLLRGLQRVIQNEDKINWGEKIWKLVIYLNFNKERIFQYAKQQVYTKAIHGKSLPEIIDSLSLLLKDLKPAEVNQHLSYETNHISLKMYYENLIIEEIHWSKSTLLLHSKVIQLVTTLEEVHLWAILNIELNRIPCQGQGESWKL